MTDLIKRGLTGLLFVSTVIGCTLWNQYSFAGLFLVVLIFGLIEFNNFVSAYNNEKKSNWLMYIIGVVMFISFHFAAFTNNISLLLASIPFIMVLFISEIFRKDSDHFKRTASSIMGIVYIALPISLINYLAVAGLPGYNPKLILGYIVLLWANDTGAYVFGVSMGKHKLFERISAKKTWEGAIGGAITTIAVAYGVFIYTGTLSIVHWVAIALITVVFGSLGDLVESSIKRRVGVKDSGNILPGHGGVLDRFDGLLISLPVVVTYLYLFA
ncbi:MAG: phosphatidate cytidylyltransferase [Flavobacteriales bacterium]|nr:phosphatidate cytidylyltransferase [Flavobacteriales bacterium]